MIVFPFEEPKNGSYKVFVLFIADNVPAASTTKGSQEHPIYIMDVTSTTPTEVPGVLPVIAIFCLRDYSQYYYTTFVGVLPMSTPSGYFLTVREWSHKYYTTFMGVLPQKWYSACGTTPRLLKNRHWEYS